MTAHNYNYHRIEAMQKHIKKLEAKLRGADDKLEWFDAFADYIAEQHANEYNQACHFADENLEIEDRLNHAAQDLGMTRQEYNNKYIKPLQKL
jgi:AAA15 family ATPase/GTPase